MRAFFAKKPVKICAVTAGILAVLAAAFFLAPGARQAPAPGATAASSAVTSTKSRTDTSAFVSTQSQELQGLQELQETQPEQSETETSAPTVFAAQTTQTQPQAKLPTTLPSLPTAPATATAKTATATMAATASAAVSASSAGKISSAAAKFTYANTAKAPGTSAANSTNPINSTARPASSPATATAGTAAPAIAQPPAAQSGTVTISIRCDTVLANMEKLRAGRNPPIPSNGVILAAKTVAFNAGDTVFTVLQRETRAAGMHMEFFNNPAFNSVYIEGINNLYEFDFGELSGWMYRVNGWFPNYGCGSCALKQGDAIEWVYTCDLGKDVGGDKAAQG